MSFVFKTTLIVAAVVITYAIVRDIDDYYSWDSKLKRALEN
jgi:hypothetical protein